MLGKNRNVGAVRVRPYVHAFLEVTVDLNGMFAIYVSQGELQIEDVLDITKVVKGSGNAVSLSRDVELRKLIGLGKDVSVVTVDAPMYLEDKS